MEGKGGQCVGLKTLHHLHVPIVLKSGSLNLVKPSGPGQASNGITLFLPIIIIIICMMFRWCQNFSLT
jgi:hypothetical protein